MDYFSSEALSTWLMDYGSIALFILLAMGILALPIPEETLMIAAGVMIHNDLLAPLPTLLAAYGGSIFGMTLSYILGTTAGNFFLEKGSKWLGISHSHLERAHNWFVKFGTWTLMIGYFIPGVRHFTGFAAGTTRLEYRRFALFAYIGAILWASSFIAIGYFFGDYFIHSLHKLNLNIDDLISLSLLVIAIYLIYRLRKNDQQTPSSEA